MCNETAYMQALVEMLILSRAHLKVPYCSMYHSPAVWTAITLIYSTGNAHRVQERIGGNAHASNIYTLLVAHHPLPPCRSTKTSHSFDLALVVIRLATRLSQSFVSSSVRIMGVAY